MFFWLLRLGLNTADRDSLAEIERPDEEREKPIAWRQIFEQGVRQGVAAIQFDGLQKLHSADDCLLKLPGRGGMMQWYAHTMQVENNCRQQYELASQLASLFQENSIRTIVLKGIAAGMNYPVPHHRPCGDLDCFLMGDYERGNQVAAAAGAEVRDSHYKHSHISYKGLAVENHQYCTAIREGQQTKSLERLLQLLLQSGGIFIGQTRLECPPPMFDALFLTYHSQHHFLCEGIAVRHLCDWAMFLKNHARDVDWTEFQKYCQEFDMHRFADAMTRLSKKHLHVDIPQAYIVAPNEELDAYMMNEILTGMHEKPFGKKAWKVRLTIIKDILKNSKRHSMISNTSYISHLSQLIYGFLFDKSPKI